MRVHRIVHPTKLFVSRKTRNWRLIGFLERGNEGETAKDGIIGGKWAIGDARRARKINVSACRGRRKSSGDLSGKLKNFPTGIPNLSYPRSAKWL